MSNRSGVSKYAFLDQPFLRRRGSGVTTTFEEAHLCSPYM